MVWNFLLFSTCFKWSPDDDPITLGMKTGNKTTYNPDTTKTRRSVFDPPLFPDQVHSHRHWWCCHVAFYDWSKVPENQFDCHSPSLDITVEIKILITNQLLGINFKDLKFQLRLMQRSSSAYSVFIDNKSRTVWCKLKPLLLGTNDRPSLLFWLFRSLYVGFSLFWTMDSCVGVIKLAHVCLCCWWKPQVLPCYNSPHETLTFHTCYLSNLLGEGATMNKHPDSIESFKQK